MRQRSIKPRNKAVLVTVADAKFVAQAKQLFASARVKGAWKGDYCLLARGISEEDRRWFEDRGVIVKACDPAEFKAKDERDVRTWYVKFCLLSTYFRRWERVVYLDSDIIVRYPLDALLHGGGLWAAPDVFNFPVRIGFVPRALVPRRHRSDFARLEQEYDLDAVAFNSGVLSFTTDIITDSSVQQLIDLYRRFSGLGLSDQSYLNLLFRDRWCKLGAEFNMYASVYSKYRVLRPEQIDGVILHFIGIWKPWKGGPFRKEWQDNLRTAEEFSAVPAWRKVREADAGFVQDPRVVDRLRQYESGTLRFKLFVQWSRLPHLLLQSRHPALRGVRKLLRSAFVTTT